MNNIFTCDWRSSYSKQFNNYLHAQNAIINYDKCIVPTAHCTAHAV